MRFFVHLLDQLNDRVNIEQIAKRVRKRASDFADHTGLWKYICESYIQVSNPLLSSWGIVRQWSDAYDLDYTSV